MSRKASTSDLLSSMLGEDNRDHDITIHIDNPGEIVRKRFIRGHVVEGLLQTPLGYELALYATTGNSATNPDGFVGFATQRLYQAMTDLLAERNEPVSYELSQAHLSVTAIVHPAWYGRNKESANLQNTRVYLNEMPARTTLFQKDYSGDVRYHSSV